MSSQVKRLSIAAVCVMALLGFPALTCATSYNRSSQVVLSQDSSWSGLPSYYAPGSNMVEGLFGRLSNAYLATSLPQNFETEFFDPGQWGENQCFATEGVVGIQWSSNLGQEPQVLYDALKESGWERVGASEEGYSFIKSAGTYRWMNLQVFKSGSYTSVVLYYRKEE